MASRYYALKGETRAKAGKGVARALRRENKIPAVIYGDGKEPVTISLPAKELTLEYLKGHMATSLCNLALDGKDNLVLVRDLQFDPIRDDVTHVDFLRVTPKTRIRINVPAKFVNEKECPGITADKGILNIVMHDIELSCIATDIPDHIDIDLTGLKIGDSIKLSSLKLPQGVKPASARDLTVATIIEARRFVEEVVATAAAAPADGAAATAAGAAAAPAADAKAGDAKAADAKAPAAKAPAAKK